MYPLLLKVLTVLDASLYIITRVWFHLGARWCRQGDRSQSCAVCYPTSEDSPPLSPTWLISLVVSGVKVIQDYFFSLKACMEFIHSCYFTFGGYSRDFNMHPWLFTLYIKPLLLPLPEKRKNLTSVWLSKSLPSFGLSPSHISLLYML